jgi:2-methylcitrate dehydratase PrpD
MSYTTQLLAEYVLGLDCGRLPSAVTEAVKDALIDVLAAAAAGITTPAARHARRTAARLFVAGPSDVWFDNTRLRPEAAALANSTAASALDLDDGHRAAGGHPGAAILPSVLAVAQATGAGVNEIIAATVAGYDVAVRIAAARDFSRLDTLSTGRWSAYGAAAAAGRLQRVATEVLAQALAIAGVLSPGLSAAGYSAIMGNQAKEGIPWSVLTGLTALELAKEGMTGPLDILDHPDYFDAPFIVRSLGSDYAITGIYFKPYACCRWIHAAIDGLIELMESENLEADRINGITVLTFERALRLNNYPDPPSIEAAQYSLPFCLALAAREGAEALLPISQTRLADPQIVNLARRISLAVDAELDQRFPVEAGARVILEVGGKRLEQEVRFPLGDPRNPLGHLRLIEKFERLAGGVLPAADRRRLISAVTTIENRTVEDLVPLLRGPATGS